MEGPRSLTRVELPSLAVLVDTVFMDGEQGRMARCFPTMFNEANCANLLGFVDQSRVVAHLGMTQRWASLGGALVRVACIGAVATYPEYRGRGLASTLLRTACARATADGVDFMLISGGLGIYRRAGAADFGRDWRVTVPRTVAERLALDGVALRPMVPEDVPFCAAAYAEQAAHFIRPRDDWEWFLQSQTCMGKPVELLLALRNDVPCAYLVCHKPEDDNEVFVVEHAGDGIAAAVVPLLDRYGARAAAFHVQGTEPGLLHVLKSAGAHCEQEASHGTLLLLNVPQLIDRLRPYFETVVGIHPAKALTVEQSSDQFSVRLGPETATWKSNVAAAEAIFGHWDRPSLQGMLGKAFPVPSLWYGLNYV
jgi:GNAT superfamily N-acetyltransferase